MWNFENNAVNGVIEYKYSRFIASWIKVCDPLGIDYDWDGLFKEWLRQLNVPEEDITNMAVMAACGKLELETNAKKFLEGIPKVAPKQYIIDNDYFTLV